jgi:hypothetical protein
VLHHACHRKQQAGSALPVKTAQAQNRCAEPSPKPGRQRGIARFATYYKVQTYDPRSLCWLDIQKQHPTPEAARAAYPPGRRCRVMEVTPQGRQPIA